MAKRVVIAGILGGLTMFVWLFVAHEFLPLGEMGVGEIPNEGPVLSAMQSSIPQAGVYLYPGMGLGPKPTAAQRNAAMPGWMKKYEQSPHGMLIYHPPSGSFSFGTLLAREGALNLLEGLLAAWLLSWAAAGRAYSARAGFVVIVGALVSVTTNVEYWNWYDFPGNYVAGYMVTQIIGFTLVGLVVAAFVKSEVTARS
jgi:drug/metabolite transporter superfamily protein YnfA